MRQLYFIAGLALGFILAYLLFTPRPPAPLDETTQAEWRRPVSKSA